MIRWTGNNLLRVLIAALCLIIAPPAAFADCVNPAGTEGGAIYNTSTQQFQYCDGDDWISMHPPGSGSGGCANPAISEGSLIYNPDYRVLQGCAGNVWRAMGPVGGTAAVTDGLVGHWKLDETTGATVAVDSAGTNNGTLIQMDPNGDWVPGKIGNALEFSGGDDEVSSLNTTGLQITGELTIAGWVNPASLPVGGDYYFLVYSYRGTDAAYFMTIWHNNGDAELNFGFHDGVAYRDETTTTAPFPSAGQWYHIAATYEDNTDTIRLYVNGSPQADDGLASAYSLIAGMNDDLYIGTDFFGVNPYAGAMDDIRIYNRALSPEEVTAIYDATGADYTTGLAGHWKLDETSGLAVSDASENNNDGTFAGEAAVVSQDGIIHKALLFDGVDDYVSVPGSPSLDIRDAPLSISAWIDVDSFASTEKSIVQNSVPGGYLYHFRVSRPFDENSPYKLVFTPGGGGDNNISNDIAAAVMETGWRHVVVTFDRNGTNEVRFYLDGQHIGTDTDSVVGGYASGTDSFFIGRGRGDSDDFPGLIDDVRIYDRALTEDDVLGLYLNSERFCTDPARAEAALIYNSSSAVMQYCDGASWVAIGKKPEDCPSIGDVCSDGSYYIGQIGGNDIYATDAASEVSQTWNNGTINWSTTNVVSTTDGEGNTSTLIGLTGNSDYPFAAAEYCDGLTNVHGHSDWYLPAKDELNLFWNGGSPVAGVDTGGSLWYWASTENSNSGAWLQLLSSGVQSNGSKNQSNLVRCVRR